MTPGSVIGGKYRLVRLLGRGAMGEVWAAVNESTGGEVALKLLSRPREELRHRLLREARACGKLRHRNVIDVHDVDQTDEGEPFLVLSLLTGETLAELLERQRRLEPSRAAQIGRDIARALAAAHRAGIVHRDLKPANVFLHREEGADDVVVKVLDFGVSKDLEGSDGLTTIAGATVGSPAYMSPEQARSARDLDQRTDLWSLGVVLFEMITGKRPFDGDAHQVLAKIALGPIPLVSDFVRNADPALVTLVARCLERDRARRFGSAEDVASALDRFVQPLVSTPPPSEPRAPGDAAALAFPGAASPLPPIAEELLDDDGNMPTMRWNREVLGAMVKTAIASLPGAGAAALPDPVGAPPLAKTSPTSGTGVPRAPRFGAPPLPGHAGSSALSSMAPVVQHAGAPSSHAAALGAGLTPRIGTRRRRALRGVLLALGGAVLVLLGVIVARALHARSPALPAPAVAPPANAPPPVQEAPPPDTARPRLTATPTETAAPRPPPPATTAHPGSTPKREPSRKNAPARSNGPVLLER